MSTRGLAIVQTWRTQALEAVIDSPLMRAAVEQIRSGSAKPLDVWANLLSIHLDIDEPTVFDYLVKVTR